VISYVPAYFNSLLPMNAIKPRLAPVDWTNTLFVKSSGKPTGKTLSYYSSQIAGRVVNNASPFVNILIVPSRFTFISGILAGVTVAGMSHSPRRVIFIRRVAPEIHELYGAGVFTPIMKVYSLNANVAPPSFSP